MTTSEFIEKINEMLSSHDLSPRDIDSIYADAADPESIEVFCRNGLNTYPSVKDVKAKIDTTRETKIHVSERCVNLIRELPEYEWRKNKDGEILEEPKKVNDHAIDALCYCVYGVRGKLSRNRPVSDFDFNQLKIY